MCEARQAAYGIWDREEVDADEGEARYAPGRVAPHIRSVAVRAARG